jgi:hypothetical protein
VAERERVRRRPGRHQEHRDVALEDFADAALDAPSQVVVAIA